MVFMIATNQALAGLVRTGWIGGNTFQLLTPAEEPKEVALPNGWTAFLDEDAEWSDIELGEDLPMPSGGYIYLIDSRHTKTEGDIEEFGRRFLCEADDQGMTPCRPVICGTQKVGFALPVIG